ncbi:MAG: hypothetical protein V4509_01760 [Patescibacteria group bacterium]
MNVLRPNGKRILATIEDTKEVKHNGIILPGVEKRIIEAKIIAVGDEIEDMNAGDVILIDRYSGQEINYRDQKYLMLKLDDILATIDQNGQSPMDASTGSVAEAL